MRPAAVVSARSHSVQRAPTTAEIVPTTVEELLAAARATLLRLVPVAAQSSEPSTGPRGT
jgi:hypothetical protein